MQLFLEAGPEPVIVNWYGHCVRLSVNKLGGVWRHAPPGKKIFKLGTLRSLLKPCLCQNATRISTPVVSVAREAIEPSCQKWTLRTTPMLAPPQFVHSSHAQLSPLKIFNFLVDTLDAWRLEKVRRRPLRRPKLRRTAQIQETPFSSLKSWYGHGRTAVPLPPPLCQDNGAEYIFCCVPPTLRVCSLTWWMLPVLSS